MGYTVGPTETSSSIDDDNLRSHALPNLSLRHPAVFSLQSAVQQALMLAAAQQYSSFDACLAL